MKGKTIAITRSEADAAEFVELATASGATPVTLSTIELVGKGDHIVDEFLASIQEYDPDYVVFMSSKAARLLFDAARRQSKYDQLRLAVANCTVVAVGPKTRDALGEQGIRVAHMPDRYSSVGIGEVMTRLHAAGRRVLVPRSGASTPFLKQLLSKIGVHVREINLYDVRASQETAQWDGFREALSGGRVDGMIFTSASSVRAFREIMAAALPRADLPGLLKDTQVVSIGPFTAEELEKLGIRHMVSGVHTVPGAFEEMRGALGCGAARQKEI